MVRPCANRPKSTGCNHAGWGRNDQKAELGNLLAIGGITAGLALLAGVPAAQADELADLRANQQLLQQRIDQLAQAEAQDRDQTAALFPPGISGGGGTIPLGTHPPPPGTGTTAGSFPRSFLIPGTDTSIRVGGFVDLTILDFLQGGGAVDGSNFGSNAGQNGNLKAIPLASGFVPGLGFVNPSATARAPSRNNGVLEFSPQQSRIDIETRTPTAWGEARTFLAFDWAGCSAGANYTCQTSQQSGGDSLLPRLRFAYGTLGGFLAGQALSNFSDADADTELMDFGGIEGSTGGQRIPQVRYTLAGPLGSAFSVSAENPWTSVITPGGLEFERLCLVRHRHRDHPAAADDHRHHAVQRHSLHRDEHDRHGRDIGDRHHARQPDRGQGPEPDRRLLLGAALGARGLRRPGPLLLDRRRHAHQPAVRRLRRPCLRRRAPRLVRLDRKDDFLFSGIAGNGIGNYASGGDSTLFPLASNFTVTTACDTPIAGKCTGQYAASNIIFHPIVGYSANGGYQHWWTPNLRSTFAIGFDSQDVSSQLIGPTQAEAVNKRLWDGLINLVWNPVGFITTGVQYMYGHRLVVANLSGHENVLVYKFRVAF